MKLDNEQQRQQLLMLLDAATFPGNARESVFLLGKSIETAELEKPQSMAAKTPTG